MTPDRSSHSGHAPLHAEGVSVSIGGTSIIHGVSCGFPTGIVTGILGPNGAGKTTFLRTLAGTTTPTSGTVRVHGRPISEHTRRSLAQHVGVIPQHTEFALELSVREIVAMGRFCHRPIYAALAPSDHLVIEDALRSMALTEMADRPAHTLSGGERQRMFLAQLLAQGPSIILLDEPTSHLDIKYQGEILRTIRELVTREKWTAGIVLHDLNLAYNFCDRLLFLRSGATVVAGNASDVAHPDVIRETFGVDAEFTTHDGRPHVILKV